MFVGIDFEKSNASIANFQAEKLPLFELDPRNQNPNVLPSFTYITKEQEVFVGEKEWNFQWN